MFLKRLPLGAVSANCYVIADESTGTGAVIDPGECNRTLLNSIREAGIRELRWILLTHGHFDHMSGAEALQAAFPEAKIAVGEADSPMLSDADKSLATVFGAPFVPCCADRLLHNGDTVTVGGLNLEVLSTPGHSPGGVCYIVKQERLVFTGDTLFKFTVGRTDLYGGSFSVLLDSLEKLMHLPDDYAVYTGHNIPTTIGDERTGNRYLGRRHGGTK